MAFLTADGLTIETLEDILTKIENDQKALIDPAIVVAAEEPLGQINGSIANALRQAWEGLQFCVNALNPDANEGTQQDNTAALTGIVRRSATKSTLTDLTLNLNASITVSAGAVIQVSGDPTRQFVLDSDVTSTTAGNYAGTATAVNEGPTTASAGTVTEIVNPVPGWNSVTNGTDATVGRNAETDEEFRIRRDLFLARAGSASPDGLIADLLDLSDSLSVQVYENPTALVDLNGLLPYLTEIVVYDGSALGTNLSDDQIAQSIWDSRAAGTGLQGNDEGNATDSQDNLRPMKFSRPEAVDIYITLTAQITTGALSSFDVQVIKDAIVEGYIPLPGEDVTTSKVLCEALDIPNVEDVPLSDIFIGYSASPTTSSNLAIGIRQIADLDTSRITVNLI